MALVMWGRSVRVFDAISWSLSSS